MKTTRRIWLTSTTLALGLVGCGFELRKPLHYSFNTLYSNIPPFSPFGIKFKRSLESSGEVEVITDPREIERAQVIFDQLFELREKVVVGRTSTGAVREYQLRLRYRFRLRSKSGIELIPDTEITLNRDINFNETGALSTELQEALLYRDMENDLIIQIQFRLAAIRQI